jgi:hypothetical protein
MNETFKGRLNDLGIAAIDMLIGLFRIEVLAAGAAVLIVAFGVDIDWEKVALIGGALGALIGGRSYVKGKKVEQTGAETPREAIRLAKAAFLPRAQTDVAGYVASGPGVPGYDTPPAGRAMRPPPYEALPD